SSCVELNNEEIAIVLRQNPANIDRPIIKIVLNNKREKINGPIVDLGLEKSLNILRAIYPQKYDINPAEHLITL
ncbi:MAG: hypothetical protein ABIL44_03105, partial [candidate division WOR-3 bacterium]